MSEWRKVTGQKQFIKKKTTEVFKARGFANIQHSEHCDGKSQKWIDPITFDQWGQRIITSLQWQECDILSEEGVERASI